MCLWRGAWPIVRSHLLLAVYSRRLRTLMHTAVSSASPGCCWWCRQDACTHETSGTGRRGTSSRRWSSEPDRGGRQTCIQERVMTGCSKKALPLGKAPFKIANCCKCCRLLGRFTARCAHVGWEDPRQMTRVMTDASSRVRRANKYDQSGPERRWRPATWSQPCSSEL